MNMGPENRLILQNQLALLYATLPGDMGNQGRQRLRNAIDATKDALAGTVPREDVPDLVALIRMGCSEGLDEAEIRAVYEAGVARYGRGPNNPLGFFAEIISDKRAGRDILWRFKTDPAPQPHIENCPCPKCYPAPITERLDAALHALRLHRKWEDLPTDRGGKDGAKGRAWAAFVDARDRVLGDAPASPLPDAGVMRRSAY